jgi:hypothetical protein
MNRSFFISNSRSSIALVFAIIFSVHAFAEDEELEKVSLSPFTVNAADNDGYRATSTLAGSRVNSKLRDLGASIAVVTQEFMNDIGATDGESLLSYIGNVEVAGTQGNFSDVNPSSASTNDSRINPQSSQRVRGLEQAALTRDYFNTNIPFDSYNTSRVTVNRGPNSILFGLGTSGGVINNTLSRARIGSNHGEAAFRFDHRGGYRGILNLNKTLIKDRLAIKVSYLNEHLEYQQKPAFEKDERLYFAWDSTLSKNESVSWLGRTSFRGSFEDGKILRNPPDVVPPKDHFTGWFEGLGGQEALNNVLRVPGTSLTTIPNNSIKSEWVVGAIAEGLVEVPQGMDSEQYAAIEGQFIPKIEHNRLATQTPANTYGAKPYFIWPSVNFNNVDRNSQPGWEHSDLTGIQGIVARWRPNGFSTQDFVTSATPVGGAGFVIPLLQNREVFDYHNLLFQGSTNEVTTKFESSQFFIEQELFDGNAGFELAFDRQTRDQQSLTAFSSFLSKAIIIDITSHHAPADSNLDGTPDRTPNENVGRPMAHWGDTTTTTSSDEQDTYRATLFGTLDTEDYTENWLGNVLGSHTITGLYEKRTNDFRTRDTRGVWWADQGDHPGARNISNGDNDNFRRQMNAQVYLGPDTRGINSPDDVRIDGYVDVRVPQIGDTYGIWYWDDAANVGVQNEWRVIEALRSANLSKTELEAKAVSVQSHFLWNHLVGMYSFRNDKQQSWRRLQQDSLRGPTGSMARFLSDPGDNKTDGNFNEALLFLEDEPFDTIDGDTSTWSIVGYYPEDWLGELPWGIDLSFHLYEADSIQPVGGEVNILNEPLASPSGVTNEWGTTLTLLDDRLSIRFNKFKTSRKNARAGFAGLLSNITNFPVVELTRIANVEEQGLGLFPSPEDALLTPYTVPSNLSRETGTDADLLGVSSFDEYYERIIASIPPSLQEIYNVQVIKNADGTIDVNSKPLDGTLQTTQDFVAEGIEIDAVGRITQNWTVSLNIAQQKTITSNFAPVAFPLFIDSYNRAESEGLFDLRAVPDIGSSNSNGFYWERNARAWRLEKAQEGTVSQEQREWRVNLISRYDFREGLMKGFGLGASFRYQSAVNAGYPNKWDEFGDAVADVDNPFKGPDQLNGDLFIRYRRPLKNDAIWTIQFNARNLYRKNGNDDTPILYNPDRRLAILSIPNARQFYLSNTFSF